MATGYIDLQAHFYDPLIGQFMQVDPFTEGQDEFSPYHYSFNNPCVSPIRMAGLLVAMTALMGSEMACHLSKMSIGVATVGTFLVL